MGTEHRGAVSRKLCVSSKQADTLIPMDFDVAGLVTGVLLLVMMMLVIMLRNKCHKK